MAERSALKQQFSKSLNQYCFGTGTGLGRHSQIITSVGFFSVLSPNGRVVEGGVLELT
jgi:hypothetical protein